MWIVNIALKRPYTFIVMALLILLISPLVILRTPTDIFPNVDIPVIAALWNYQGLSAEEMEERVASPYERSMTTVVTDIDHMESQTVNGRSITKVFFHPGTRVDLAMAEMTAVAQNAIHQMPPGSQSPYMLVYSASSVPILQLALSGQGLSEQQLFDYAANFIRTQLATVQGAAIPWPYGGKQRQVMIDLQPALLQSKGLSPADVVNAVSTQNLILPTGTSKIGQFEYDVGLNASPETIRELNDLPVRAAGQQHHLCARRGSRARRLFAADQHRPPQWPAQRAAQHPESWRHLHARHRQAGAGLVAANRRHASARAQNRADRRPILVRSRRHQRRDSRGDYRRVPYRHHDPAVSRELAQHAHHCHLDPAYRSCAPSAC